MDRLDKIAVSLMVLLLAVSFLLIARERVRPPTPEEIAAQQAVSAGPRYIDSALVKKLDLAQKLIVGGNLNDAGPILDEIIAKTPYEARAYMLKGDIALRRQESVAAIRAYRRAVDLEPDYLDKKSKLFQGKKIKKAVEEATEKIKAAIEEQGTTPSLEADKKLMYYMLRKIAGSCG